MRQQRSGRIVNVSSLAGLSASPFMGMYSASKFALEGFGETLRIEVQPFGIHVSQVEAGFLNTPMQAHRQMTAGRIAEYDTYRERAHQAIAEYEARGPGADLVAQAVARIVSSRNPRLRYVLGRQARFVVRVRRLLPAGMFEQGVRRHFRLDDGGR